MLRGCGAEAKSSVPSHPAHSRHGWTRGCALRPALFPLVTAFKPQAGHNERLGQEGPTPTHPLLGVST